MPGETPTVQDTLTTSTEDTPGRSPRPPSEPPHVGDEPFRALVDRLDLEKKVRLLTGADFWGTHPEPAVGLRRLVFSDGPSGVRGERFDERDPSLSLPSASALGASWDPALARRYGQVLADEARRKGVDVVLGPTINLHRSPFAGRHFESFSEDPLLTAELATAYVSGLQERGVAATPKHYVANDAETERFTVDNQVDERTLREVYLAPFEQVATRARAWLVMSAYNAVNGTTMTEHNLLHDPLATEWGFDGVVVSDWIAVRTTEASANAAQDLVMPGPDGPWGQSLLEAVLAGRVPVSAVDDKVVRLLRLAARVGALEGFPPAVAVTGPIHDGPAVAREVATRGMVLVHNTPAGLPWQAGRLTRVAVIGHHGTVTRDQGGGSASVVTDRVLSPLDGLRAALAGSVDVVAVPGAAPSAGVTPLPRDATTNPLTGGPGARVRYLAQDGTELAAEDRLACDLVYLSNGVPAGTHTIELHTRYRPKFTATEYLAVAASGRVRLVVDGVEHLDVEHADSDDPIDTSFLRPPWTSVPLEVAAGGDLEIRVSLAPPLDGPFLAVSLTLGLEIRSDPVPVELARAAEAARAADVAVVVVGTDDSVESEGFDRTTLSLPGHQDDLVRAVAAANPRTVVVVNCGAPILMPWRHEVAAVLLGWFGGQEFGTALADVLLGVREPGGRLPTTWPESETAPPVLPCTPEAGVLRYTEGIHLGYRGWLRADTAPAFPFGYGLGYTSWKLRALSHPASITAGEPLTLAVTVANTGERTGRHVIQVYLARSFSEVEYPTRWLAGFTSVELEAGAVREVDITVPARSFQHYRGGWRNEPGEFRILVGHSVSNISLDSRIRVIESAAI